MEKKLDKYIIILALAITVLITRVVALSVQTSVPTMLQLETMPVIVIDAGHGGGDGGAVGVDGIVEKDINLAIAINLRDMLTASGFDVIMTRDDDRSIHDEGVMGTKKQKTSDLHNRLKIAEAQYPNVLFISIHQNKFEKASPHGAQVFYGPNNENSERLAQIIQTEIALNLEPDNTRQIKKAEKNLYLMYTAKCPSVLVECGFLSNPNDAAKLTTAEYQKELSFSIMTAILSFLDMDQISGVEAVAVI